MTENVVTLFNGKVEGTGGGGKPPTSEGIDPLKCPVKAIGKNGAVYYYVTPNGELRDLTAHQHTAFYIFSLFDEDVSWLSEHFYREPTRSNTDNWDFRQVARYLMYECHKMGIVDLEKSLRGVGVWRTKKGHLVVHSGDEIFYRGEWGPAGQKIDDMIFIALPPVDRPSFDPMTKESAHRLYRFLDSSWSWSNPGSDAMLLLGWIGCGIAAGSLKWRPHAWLTAAGGAGKSKFDALAQALLGSGSDKVSDPTAAGVRALLGVSARGILADEVEPGENNRAANMVELARLASTDSQGAVVRGTSDGRSQRFPIRACFLFSSILVPNFRPQDHSRITVFEMRSLAKKTSQEIRDFEAQYAELCETGPEFRSRVINGFARFEKNLETYSHLMAEDGNSRRAADQVATMLAMADAILDDNSIGEDHGRQMLKSLSVSELTGGTDIGDDIECLTHLLSSQVLVQFNDGTQKFPVGELIAGCKEELPKDWQQRGLRRLGMAVVWEHDTGYFLISNTHEAVKRLFRDSRWCKGGHSRVLKRLPFAQRDADRTISFAGLKSRATWLLLDDLPIERKSKKDLADDPPTAD